MRRLSHQHADTRHCAFAVRANWFFLVWSGAVSVVNCKHVPQIEPCLKEGRRSAGKSRPDGTDQISHVLASVHCLPAPMMVAICAWSGPNRMLCRERSGGVRSAFHDMHAYLVRKHVMYREVCLE